MYTYICVCMYVHIEYFYEFYSMSMKHPIMHMHSYSNIITITSLHDKCMITPEPTRGYRKMKRSTWMVHSIAIYCEVPH